MEWDRYNVNIYIYMYIHIYICHVFNVLLGDMAQKLFWISEKGSLSGAARSHANLLRSGSVPPLQRLCQEAVLRAPWEKCMACTCWCASRPRALEYTTVYGQSAKKDIILIYMRVWRAYSGRTRGVINHRWEGRDPLFTFGFEEQ